MPTNKIRGVRERKIKRREVATETISTPLPKTFDFNIGADPEFLLFFGKKLAKAEQAMRPFFSKERLPEVSHGYVIGTNGELGWDNHRETAEIRPVQNKDPMVLTTNIEELFKKLNETMPFIDITTLSIQETVGGHVHLEIPANKATLFSDNAKQSAIIRIMASYIIPILASEHRICAASRYTTEYGKATNVRIEQKGSARTFELRGITAEWTVNKELCYATLAYLGVVWNEILTNHSNILKNEIIFKNKTQVTSVQEMLLSDYKPVIQTIIKEIEKSIKTFKLYPNFKEEIDLILDIEKTKKIKKDLGWNIKKGWNFEKIQKVSKKEILATNFVNKKLKEINFEEIKSDYSLLHNDDYNIKIFANAISERIAALGWNLQNEYLFFGLAKGTKGYAAANVGKNQYYTIPTNRPKAEIEKILKNMRKKYFDYRGTSIKIDPRTGKTIGGKRDAIMVGIPYDVRADKNIKSLIKLIWDIENDIQKHKKLEEYEELTEKGKEEPPTITPEANPDFVNSLTEQQEFHTEDIVSRIWSNPERIDLEETNLSIEQEIN